MNYICKCGKEYDKSQSLNSRARWSLVHRDGLVVNKTTSMERLPIIRVRVMKMFFQLIKFFLTK
jgi:hypothetical protein